MFGKGKSSPKKSSGTPFNAKQFLLDHCEKIILAIFIGFTGWLVYDGFSANTFESAKTPEDLSGRSSRALDDIVNKNHWEVIKAEPGRLVKAKFAAKSETARQPTLADPYIIGRLDGKDLQKGGKRGDPEVIAPFDVRVQSYFGAIAISSNKTAPADELDDAPAVADEKKRGRAKPSATTTDTVERKLAERYDKGFQKSASGEVDKGRKAKPKDAKVVPKIVKFNAVTAVVDHEKLLMAYKQEFELAPGYQPNRDSPNYLGYQVQRADVTGAVDQEIAEDKWLDATTCNTKEQLKMLDIWAGEAKEVSEELYLEKDILTMPIPPVLLSDYRPLATHPLIPEIKPVAATGLGATSAYGQSGGSTYGQSGGSGGPGGPGGSQYGVGASPNGPSAGGAAGYGQSGGGRAGPVAPAMTAEETALIAAATPKTPTFSTYKMIRFFDFNVEPNRIYRYRVRFVVEDPNFPRLETFKVNTSSMKSETVVRVQQMEDAYRAEVLKMGTNKKVLIRDSKLSSKWSKPSSTISLTLPTELYASKLEAGSWTQQKIVGGQKQEFATVESIAARATLVYAEWDIKLALLVPKSTSAERGTVLSGPGPEWGLDVIHPVTKVIKQLTGFAYSDPVTVADIRGGQPLAAEKRLGTKGAKEDPLPSAGEVVAFNPRTGDLVISREFSDLERYRMYSFSDEIEAADEKAKK